MKIKWCLEMCDFQITANCIHCYWSDINKMEDHVLLCFKKELSLNKTEPDELKKEIRSKAAEIIYTMSNQITEQDMYGKTDNGRDVKQPESLSDSNHYDVYDSGTGTMGKMYRLESNFPQDRHENPQDQKDAAEEGPELPPREYKDNNQGPKLPPKLYENCYKILPENSLVQKDAIENGRGLQPSEHCETDERGYESLCGKSQLISPPPRRRSVCSQVEMPISETGPKLPLRKHGNNHPIRRESLKVYSDEDNHKAPGRRSVYCQAEMHTSEAGPKLPHENNHQIRRKSLKDTSEGYDTPLKPAPKIPMSVESYQPK